MIKHIESKLIAVPPFFELNKLFSISSIQKFAHCPTAIALEPRNRQHFKQAPKQVYTATLGTTIPSVSIW